MGQFFCDVAWAIILSIRKVTISGVSNDSPRTPNAQRKKIVAEREKRPKFWADPAEGNPAEGGALRLVCCLVQMSASVLDSSNHLLTFAVDIMMLKFLTWSGVLFFRFLQPFSLDDARAVLQFSHSYFHERHFL